MKLLRDALVESMRRDITMPREQRVRYGVEKILDAGLFKQYADEFKAYIVSNALSQAEGDFEASGRSPRTGTTPSTPPKPKPAPMQVAGDKAQARKDAEARLVDLAPLILMNLPTPFGKRLGDLTGKEGRKLAGWMGRAFKGVPDNARLIDVKSEAALRELWQRKF
jgi:hypothetical protein